MPLFDFPLPTLYEYKPVPEVPYDFQDFWKMTLNETNQNPINCCLTPVETPLTTLDAYDLHFVGFGGQLVNGWLVLPKHLSTKAPCIIEFAGYGGGRGEVIDHTLFASAGFAHFIMDIRGQGNIWRSGVTPDLVPEDTSIYFPGFATKGVLSPNTYYYRRLITDGYRAVEAAASLSQIDTKRIIVYGFSQGGGVALGVAALSKKPIAAIIDFPFLCNFRRSCQIVATAPYSEIVSFCKLYPGLTEEVFATLSYFDGVNFAALSECPALFSVGLMDNLCPPSSVFAAYNHYKGSKKINVFEFSEHDGGGTFNLALKLEFLKQFRS